MHEYYFPIGPRTDQLLATNLHWACSKDPFSKKMQYFVSIGLNSKFDGDGLKNAGGRPPANICIVIDISGSMNSGIEHSAEGRSKSKLELAIDSVCNLLTLLKPQDRLSVMTFDDTTTTILPFTAVDKLEVEPLKKKLREIRAGGGTNIETALKDSMKAFDGINLNEMAYENRVIFLTDDCPTAGDTSEGGLLKETRALAAKRIFVTFLGMGVSFDSKLTEGITRTRGAVYMSITSNSEFVRIMSENFEYIMTPIVHDFYVRFVENKFYNIERIYGDSMSETNQGTDLILSGSSLMPGAFTEEKGTKGGVVLAQLNALDANQPFKLKLNYEDRVGTKLENFADLDLTGVDPTKEAYSSFGVRKAILIARYANFMQTFLTRSATETPMPDVSEGVPIPPPLSKTEAPTSSKSYFADGKFNLPAHYIEVLTQFAAYFEAEVDSLQDASLLKELKVIYKLLGKNAAE